VNFYKRHLGDYAKDAGHLSMLEHGAYTLLLDRYYTTEAPIPVADAYRITRARLKDEVAATDAVLREFFTVDGVVYRNKRADAEIGRANAQRDINRETGKRGGRPRKGTEQGTEPEPNENRIGFIPEPNDNPSQTPDSRQKQKPESAIADLSAAAPLTLVADNGRKACPHREIVALYHECLPELRRVREWNPTRQKLLARRWAEDPERQDVEWWRGFFGYVRRSPFLMGRVTGRDGRAFDCDLEWLIRPTNFAKVVEGKYEDAAA
jgi:uncharacterized protein YdaU (DUF1376 family)